MKPRFLLLGLMMLGLMGLGGCAALSTVQSDVASYGAWPAERKPSSYAFDRMPSQSRDSERQNSIETAAAAALQKAGFKPAPDMKSADVLVMVGARISLQESSPWDDPLWWRHRTSFWRHSPLLRPYYYNTLGNYRYEREVAVVLRDRQSGEALYEARASNNGPTAGGVELVGAMFEAALSDFPRTNSQSHPVSVRLAP